MTKITAIDIHWAGPGWYVRLITLDGSKDREKHEYRRIAPIDARIADLGEPLDALARLAVFRHATAGEQGEERPLARLGKAEE